MGVLGGLRVAVFFGTVCPKIAAFLPFASHKGRSLCGRLSPLPASSVIGIREALKGR
jgi:hypothetical protein